MVDGLVVVYVLRRKRRRREWRRYGRRGGEGSYSTVRVMILICIVLGTAPSAWSFRQCQ